MPTLTESELRRGQVRLLPETASPSPGPVARAGAWLKQTQPRLSDLLVVFIGFDCWQAIGFLGPYVKGGLQIPLTGVTVGLVATYLLSRSHRLRTTCLWLLVVALFLMPQAISLVLHPPHVHVHDGILLTDSAAGRLLAGQNPYGHDYIDSASARSFFMPEMPVNFGLGNYAYMPLMILLGVPTRLLGVEGSWLWLPAMALLAFLAFDMGRTRTAREAGLIGIGLNPFVQLDFFSLFNDLLFLIGILGALGQLRRGRSLQAGILFGLAVATKQQAVLFLPLLIAVAWPHRDDLLKMGAGAIATAGLLVLPFLAWNPASFVSDTTSFFYGHGVNSYPIRGLNLPGVLLMLKAIPNRWNAFPASAPLEAAATALVIWRWWRDRSGTMAKRWMWTGLVILAVFIPGRAMAPNYLDLALIAFSLSLALNLQPDRRSPTIRRWLADHLFGSALSAHEVRRIA